eukprot:SAG31_NODE_2485_length_5624_cov_2.110206_1_plen_42_part_00
MVDHLSYALSGQDTRAASYLANAPIYCLMHNFLAEAKANFP